MSDVYADPRWQRKRLGVLARDGWRCFACLDSQSELHVHHLTYSGAPWETPDCFLQTLCVSCHKSLGKHPKGGVWFFRDDDGALGVKVSWCPACKSNRWNDRGSNFKCLKCGWDGNHLLDAASGSVGRVYMTRYEVFPHTAFQEQRAQLAIHWVPEGLCCDLAQHRADQAAHAEAEALLTARIDPGRKAELLERLKAVRLAEQCFPKHREAPHGR